MKTPVNQKKDETIRSFTLEHMKVGLWTIIKHTDNLLNDSKLLLKKKKYTASVPLSILAIEEVGKTHILSQLIKIQKPLSDKIWNEITRGGVAHVTKTTSLILSRKHYLESNPENETIVDELMQYAGMPKSDIRSAKIENMLMKATFLRLEKLKHDCFYTNIDINKNWIDFDIRFKTYEKKAIANYLYIIALRLHINQKFTLSLPQKPLKDYTEEDKKIMKKKWQKEVNPIMKKTDTKELGRLTDHAMLLIHNTYSPDARGLVTEKSEGWLEF